MSSALALVGTAGVAANKVAGAISEANDANKAKQMSTKAKQNSKQAIANKKEQMANTLKKVEAVSQGQNQDLKTKTLTKELMRDR